MGLICKENGSFLVTTENLECAARVAAIHPAGPVDQPAPEIPTPRASQGAAIFAGEIADFSRIYTYWSMEVNSHINSRIIADQFAN